MPDRETLQRAQRDKQEGKATSTQAGEFIREEMHHIREGKHGARSAKQAIAIGLSKARRAGVDLPPPEEGTTTKSTRQNARRAYQEGQGKRKAKRRPKVSRAVSKVLKHEGRAAASHKALSRQARSSARVRGRASRSASARKAARTRARHG